MTATSPEGLYLPTDLVGGWRRSEIDRNVGAVQESFGAAFGQLCTPLQVSCDLAGERGEVAIFDGGCGTGNGVRSWRDRVQLQYPTAQVRAVGLNEVDFSAESASNRTRTVFREGEIEYVVARLETAACLGALADVAQAFEVLIHAPRPEHMLDGLVGVTRPGGHIFFNTSQGTEYFRGSASRRGFVRAIDQLQRTGYDITGHATTIRQHSRGPLQARTFFHIIKPRKAP